MTSPKPDSTSPIWHDPRFRALDDSIANLVRQLVFAVGAMFFAFSASRFVTRKIHLGSPMMAYLVEGGLLTVFGCVAIFFTSARPIRKAITAQRNVILDNEELLRQEAARHRFSSQVQDALEMGELESETLVVVSRAFTEIATKPAELLLADSSRAHIRQAAVSGCAGGPGCGVETPWGCPAVRRGQTLRFASSDALSACPRLADRGSDLSAVCVPVTVLGTPMGVIHMTGSVVDPVKPDHVVELETLAQQAGSRIGVLRAMASAQMQAATDPLTGSVNRRSLDSRARELRASESPFAVVLADLDHFKALNDAHGHDTGDRALRVFADVLRASVRADDTVCRYGGEEFVVLIPGIDRERAGAITRAAQGRLHAALDSGEVPRFTASFGVADSTQAETAEQVIRLADLAMFDAKNAGRDQISIARAGDMATPAVRLATRATTLAAAPDQQPNGPTGLSDIDTDTDSGAAAVRGDDLVSSRTA